VNQAAPRSGENGVCRVIWKGPPPLGRPVYITDPVWPGHPHLRHLVLATMTPQLGAEQPYVTQTTELSWLMMSEDGAGIEASGLLAFPKDKTPGGSHEAQTFSQRGAGKGRDNPSHLPIAGSRSGQ
jgi:hypothetical protein